MLFSEKISSNAVAFVNKVKGIASTLGIPPEWLMIVMNFETAGTFSPSIENPNSSATGLIQFMEATAKELGTSTAKLAAMSNVQQLDYVLKYLENRKAQYGNFEHLVDVYLAVFYPAAIDKPLSYVFPNWVYRVNKGFDLDKNGNISKAEIQDKLISTVPAEYRSRIKKKIR